MNIYVSNLAISVQDKDLSRLFGAYGSVSSAKLVTDKLTNKSKGFGFVEMRDRKAGETAVKELNGKLIDGKQMRLSEAKAKEEVQVRVNRAPSPWKD